MQQMRRGLPRPSDSSSACYHTESTAYTVGFTAPQLWARPWLVKSSGARHADSTRCCWCCCCFWFQVCVTATEFSKLANLLDISQGSEVQHVPNVSRRPVVRQCYQC